MRPIKTLYEHHNLDIVILFAGDGDFNDMVQFLMKTLKIKVYLVGWSASMNGDLKEQVTEVIYLDQIWKEVSSSQNGEPTNFEALVMLGIDETIAYAAYKKFPGLSQRDECIDFAIQLS